MKIDKIFLVVFTVCAIMWLGLTSARLIISNEMLSSKTYQYLPQINIQTEFVYFSVISKIIYLNLILYALILISAIGFILTKEISFKENPYLLTSAIMYFMFVPVEIYCANLDWNFIWLGWKNSINIEEYRHLFMERIRAFSGLPMIAILCYYTIIPLIIFKPFNKK
ncbi:MAG: hypothetical protein AAB255_01700 [Bacteroidota bacterium]